MHPTHVELEVMQMRGVAQFTRRDYMVLAWSWPEAAEKAQARAAAEGYTPIRVVQTYDAYR